MTHRPHRPQLCGGAEMTPTQLGLLDEAKDFGLRDGYAVPIHASLHIRAACFFASEDGEFSPDACKAMRRISVSAHEHVARAVRLADGHYRAPLLSARERVCLGLWASGLEDAEIAIRLQISVRTVRRHLDQAKARLGVGSRQQAMGRAIVTGQIAA